MPKKRLDAEIRKHNREVMDAALAYRRSLRIPEVANILDCCDLTVRSLIKRKELPAFRVGVEWRIRPEHLEAFMEQASA